MNIFNYIKKRKYSNTHHVLHCQRNALTVSYTHLTLPTT